MPAPTRSTYHHGHLRSALIAAARALLDEGGPAAVGLRETARRVGVSATATYRHFRDKDSLLAAVATDGFNEFGQALRASVANGQPFAAMGRAYVEFALGNPGIFRLMFGPLMQDVEKFPDMHSAASAAFGSLQSGVATLRKPPEDDVNASAVAAWSLVHGLSHLLLDGVLPKARAAEYIEAILSAARPRPAPPTA